MSTNKLISNRYDLFWRTDYAMCTMSTMPMPICLSYLFEWMKLNVEGHFHDSLGPSDFLLKFEVLRLCRGVFQMNRAFIDFGENNLGMF